jgi:NAD(P)-dependent dehydrogenase (short-subunit alcohol dehydrogenase family)
MIDLSSKVALVTGASRGIGEAISRRLASSGAHVVMAARKIESLESVAASIRSAGGQATPIACHTGKVEEIDRLVKTALERCGRIDVLVNNAATNPYFGPMIHAEWPAWDKTFEVNVKGYFHLARSVALHLIERGAPGSLINIASILGSEAAPLQGIYGMTKAAVISMTKTLAMELGAYKIRVNAIAPGFIDTKLSSLLVNDETFKNMILQRTPLQRVGSPDDIAPLCAFLASDLSAFITGAIYVADGGLTV